MTKSPPGSHAPAWEPETRRRGNQNSRRSHGTPARPNWIPTPARGNQEAE